MNSTWFESIDFCVWMGGLGLGRPFLTEIMVMSFLDRCFVPRSHKDTVRGQKLKPLKTSNNPGITYFGEFWF